MNKLCVDIKNRNVANDVIFTPKPVALKMIKMCNITPDMKVLDPSKGGGIFYDNLPECNKSYCEITEGRDFFDYTEKVDLVIGNPPYSIWDKWLDHTMKITDKFCYIFGFLNFTRKRIKKICDNGFGITEMHLLEINWWFGRFFIVVFERGKKSIISVEDSPIVCDICGTKCKRGQKGFSMNECSRTVNVVSTS